MQKLTLGNINPYIRRASTHLIEAGLNTGVRINIHYQLHYICSGEGLFTIKNKQYPANQGCFFLWGPGEEHIIKSSISNPMEVIGIQFDMTSDYTNKKYPCVHCRPETFSPENIHEHIEFLDITYLPNFIVNNNSSIIKQSLSNIVHEFESNSNYSQEIMSSLLKSALLIIYNQSINNNIENNNIMNVIEYLKKHYREKITNLELGQKFNYHHNYLNQLINDYTGFSIQQYLIKLRMNKAIDLLEHSNLRIQEIALYVGDYSLHYFSRLFKNKIGLSPSEFRK